MTDRLTTLATKAAPKINACFRGENKRAMPRSRDNLANFLALESIMPQSDCSDPSGTDWDNDGTVWRTGTRLAR
jgi:hypothetical protein